MAYVLGNSNAIVLLPQMKWCMLTSDVWKINEKIQNFVFAFYAI